METIWKVTTLCVGLLFLELCNGLPINLENSMTGESPAYYYFHGQTPLPVFLIWMTLFLVGWMLQTGCFLLIPFLPTAYCRFPLLPTFIIAILSLDMRTRISSISCVVFYKHRYKFKNKITEYSRVWRENDYLKCKLWSIYARKKILLNKFLISYCSYYLGY